MLLFSRNVAHLKFKRVINLPLGCFVNYTTLSIIKEDRCTAHTCGHARAVVCSVNSTTQNKITQVSPGQMSLLGVKHPAVGATSHEAGTQAQQSHWPLTSASGPCNNSANSWTKGHLCLVLKKDDYPKHPGTNRSNQVQLRTESCWVIPTKHNSQKQGNKHHAYKSASQYSRWSDEILAHMTA